MSVAQDLNEFRFGSLEHEFDHDDRKTTHGWFNWEIGVELFYGDRMYEHFIEVYAPSGKDALYWVDQNEHVIRAVIRDLKTMNGNPRLKADEPERPVEPIEEWDKPCKVEFWIAGPGRPSIIPLDDDRIGVSLPDFYFGLPHVPHLLSEKRHELFHTCLSWFQGSLD